MAVMIQQSSFSRFFFLFFLLLDRRRATLSVKSINCTNPSGPRCPLRYTPYTPYTLTIDALTGNNPLAPISHQNHLAFITSQHSSKIGFGNPPNVRVAEKSTEIWKKKSTRNESNQQIKTQKKKSKHIYRQRPSCNKSHDLLSYEAI